MSDDPSLVATKTLLESLENDIARVRLWLREAEAFAAYASVTLRELQRRQDTGKDAI
jgi:hypothetical protein